MNERISSVKREIRILGLDTCGQGLVIGVVNRGGYYLDGVLVFPRRDRPVDSLASSITETKYFPELKAVMVHDPQHSLDLDSIERVTKLHSIAVSTGLEHHDPKYKVKSKFFRKNASNVWFNTRLELSSAQKLLAQTWIRGQLPEPVRVAHLLAKSSLHDRIRQGKQ